MNDVELLEKAAKAVGIEWYGIAGDDTSDCLYFDIGPDDVIEWNPLTDDGDALRLAVKLQIDLVHFTGHLRADVAGMSDVYQMYEVDPYAATRRAIVRAAAEVGKVML